MFFFLFTKIWAKQCCVYDSTNHGADLCPFKDAIHVEKEKINDFFRKNNEELDIFIDCNVLAVSGDSIKNNSKLSFYSFKSSNILNFQNFDKNVSFNKLLMHNLSFYMEDFKIFLLQETELKNVTFLNERTIINSYSIKSDMLSIRNISLLISNNMTIDVDFTNFIPCVTFAKIYAPYINCVNLNENVTMKITGQEFSVTTDNDPMKNFTIIPSSRSIICYFSEFKKEDIRVSIVNMFISSRLRYFSIHFNLTTRVHFKFLKCTWSGDTENRIRIIQFNTSMIIDVETDKIPLFLTSRFSKIFINVNNDELRFGNSIYCYDSEFIISTSLTNKVPSFCSGNFFLAKESSLIIRENVNATIEYLKMYDSLTKRVQGRISVSDLYCEDGSTIIDSLTLKGKRISVDCLNANITIHHLFAEEDQLLFEFSHVYSYTNNISTRQVIQIDEFNNRTIFDCYLVYSVITFNNEAYFIKPFVAKNSDVKGYIYFARSTSKLSESAYYCIVENVSRDSQQCPENFPIIESRNEEETVVLAYSYFVVYLYVVGNVSIPTSWLEYEKNSFIIKGTNKEDSIISLSCNSFMLLSLTNVTAVFEKSVPLKIDDFSVDNSSLVNLFNAKINSYTISLSDYSILPQTNIDELYLDFNEKATINATNESITINGVRCNATKVYFSQHADEDVIVNILGEKGNDIRFSFDLTKTMYVHFYYKIGKFIVPYNSKCTVFNEEYITDELVIIGMLYLNSLNKTKLNRLNITKTGVIASSATTHIYVDTLIINSGVNSIKYKNDVIIHATTVSFGNTSDLSLINIHDTRVYLVDIMSSVLVSIPSDDNVDNITIVFNYQMVSVPFFLLLCNKNVSSVNIIMNNTGSSNQLISDSGWDCIEIGAVSITGNTPKVSSKFTSKSWAFNEDTRLFDLKRGTAKYLSDIPIYSIVRLEKEAVKDKDESETTQRVKTIILISCVSACVIIVSITVAVVVRNKLQKRKIKSFYENSVSQESLVGIY